jgi:phosphatidate cytidylyltransferase
MPLSSHQQRLITAVILLPFLAYVILHGGTPLLAGLLLVSSAGLWEFYSLFWPGRDKAWIKMVGLVLGTLILLAAAFRGPEQVLLLVLLGAWLVNLEFLRDYSGRDEARYERAVLLVAGLLYLPLVLQFFLGFTPTERFFVLLAAFVADTGAYYAGTYFGKAKIWPRISPKKTWIGSLGGLLACMAVCLGYGLALGQAPVWRWLLLGASLGVAAQLGDFFESGLKRSLGRKDSGRLLPGHGGILDRIDALLLVVLVYVLFRSAYAYF